MWRIHIIEQKLDGNLAGAPPATNAPTTKPPSAKEVWAERKEAAKEIATGIKWLAVIVLLIALALKKIEHSQLQTLKSFFGFGG